MSLSSEEKRARFERALAYGGNTHTVEDVAALVKAGKAQFWDNGGGFIVTEINEYPRLKAVNYWIVSGEMKDCLALQRDIDAWAIEQGCGVAMGCGRRGWARAAGWKMWHPNLWKPLIGDGNGYGGLRP